MAPHFKIKCVVVTPIKFEVDQASIPGRTGAGVCLGGSRVHGCTGTAPGAWPYCCVLTPKQPWPTGCYWWLAGRSQDCCAPVPQSIAAHRDSPGMKTATLEIAHGKQEHVHRYPYRVIMSDTSRSRNAHGQYKETQVGACSEWVMVPKRCLS